MNKNNLEIITVSDLIKYLNEFPGYMAVLKSDLALAGYNRFKPLQPSYYIVRANDNPALDVEFVDHDSSGSGAFEVMEAIVL